MNQKLSEHQRSIKLAVQFLKDRLPVIPKTAVILGSGLGPLAEQLKNPVIIPYEDIPGFMKSTAIGHKGRLILGEIAGCPVLAMQGRFHCYEGYDILDTVFPVRVFCALGIKNLFVTNAAGGLNRNFSDGALMLITDHIALFAPSPLWGANIDDLGPRFPDMTYAYSRDFFSVARLASQKTGIKLFEGVYAYAKGPQYETPAEIRALAVLGADAVGMSTVGEVVTARHCGMSVIGISCITNMASGIIDKPLNHLEVLATSERVSADFCHLASEIIKNLP